MKKHFLIFGGIAKKNIIRILFGNLNCKMCILAL